MYGTNMGSLDVEVSSDSGATWNSVWQTAGDKGNIWYETVVSSPRPAMPLPTASVVDLGNAIKEVTSRFKLAKAHLIGREKFSVSERMNKVLRFLKTKRLITFNQLFEVGEGRSGLVVSLVAVLELAKNQMVSVLQNKILKMCFLE